MQLLTLTRALLLLISTAVYAQDYDYQYEESYQDYAQGEGDTMYQDYAAHQERKAVGAAGG